MILSFMKWLIRTVNMGEMFPSSEMYGVNLYKVNCHLQWLLQIKPKKIGGWSEFELKFYISNLIENREQSLWN